MISVIHDSRRVARKCDLRHFDGLGQPRGSRCEQDGLRRVRSWIGPGNGMSPGKGFTLAQLVRAAAVARVKDAERREDYGGGEAAIRLIRR